MKKFLYLGVLSGVVWLLAMAFREGWYGSKLLSKWFFKEGYHIDSLQLATPADQRFKARGAASLSDGKVGDTDRMNGAWLGYIENGFESYLYFKKPVQAGLVTLSTLRNHAASIFEPTRIEVWGGTDPKALRLLKVITPAVPEAYSAGGEMKIYEAGFEPRPVTCIKVVAKPLAKIPSWHQAKGNKAWLFVDEVIVN